MVALGDWIAVDGRSGGSKNSRTHLQSIYCIPGTFLSYYIVGMVELDRETVAIINKKYLFQNKVSRSKHKKNRRRLVDREAVEISSANEQTIIKHL